jgi:hypothetical protein
VKFTARQAARADERFTLDDFAASIGSEVLFTAGDDTAAVSIVDVEVSEDGASVEVTYEIQEGPVARIFAAMSTPDTSFGFKDRAP